MIALAWTFTAFFLGLWLVEHVGGADARDRLRAQRDAAVAERDELVAAEWGRIVAASLAHSEARIAAAREQLEAARAAQPVADVVPIRRSGSGGWRA